MNSSISSRISILKRDLFADKSPAKGSPIEHSLIDRPTNSNLIDIISPIEDRTQQHQRVLHEAVKPLSSHHISDTRIRREPEEDDINEISTDEEETIEESVAIRHDIKPKPGKLDLRQFDNITTAIGKLNVAPSSSIPTPAISQSLVTSPTRQPSTAKQKKTDSKTSYGRMNNLRQNHGRAVAPPTVPTNATFKNTTKGEKSEASSQTKLSAQDDNKSAIDFSQSPIAQRVLRQSKNYRVSELNSPHESDCEIQNLGEIRRAVADSIEERLAFNRDLYLEPRELKSSRGETIRQLNEILAKKPPSQLNHSRAVGSSIMKGFSDDQSMEETKVSKNDEKNSKKDKKKLRSNEKLEKRKHKEEERLRRLEEEKQRRQEKKLASKKSRFGNSNSNSLVEDGVPLFIRRCIEFIESEGLDAEGIYRVPGNRAHVDAFVQKFKDNPDMSILESDIPINAVATALKDFLSKKWGPIITPSQMTELTDLSSIIDRDRRVNAVKELVHRLPPTNYKLLKYLFSHFVKVSLNNTLNSMDSKNLAICWWPTLLPIHFDDMVMFEQKRPHLEETIQIMIDQYSFIFDN